VENQNKQLICSPCLHKSVRILVNSRGKRDDLEKQLSIPVYRLLGFSHAAHPTPIRFDVFEHVTPRDALTVVFQE
jgi:hypothetical protein